jgi:hypothetical protein
MCTGKSSSREAEESFLLMAAINEMATIVATVDGNGRSMVVLFVSEEEQLLVSSFRNCDEMLVGLLAASVVLGVLVSLPATLVVLGVLVSLLATPVVEGLRASLLAAPGV